MIRRLAVAGVVVGLVFVVAAIAEWWALRILGNPDDDEPGGGFEQ